MRSLTILAVSALMIGAGSPAFAAKAYVAGKAFAVNTGGGSASASVSGSATASGGSSSVTFSGSSSGGGVKAFGNSTSTGPVGRFCFGSCSTSIP